MIDRHDAPKWGRDTGVARALSQQAPTPRSATRSRCDGFTALASTEQEMEMNRGGGVGIIGVIVIVVVILILVGVINL